MTFGVSRIRKVWGLGSFASRSSHIAGKWIHAGALALVTALFLSAIQSVAIAQSLNPEDVLDRVEEIEEGEIDTHFGRGYLDQVLAPLESFQSHLMDEYGLRAYGLLSPIYQAGSGTQTMNIGYDLFVRWDDIIDSPGWLGRGSMQAYGLFRDDALIGTNTADFMGSRGLAVDINDSSIGGSFTSLALIAWEQIMFDERFEFVIGQLDPITMVDSNAFAGYDRESFIHKTLASNPVRSVSDPGLGIGLRVNPTSSSYLAYSILDGSANGEYPDFDSLDDGNWAHLAEVAYQPEIEGLGQGNYRIGLQHAEASGDSPSSTTWSISFDQELGDQLGAFFRYGNGDGRLKGTEQFLSGGLAWRGVFGYNNDQIGLGGFWAEPTTPDGDSSGSSTRPRKEYGIESYYRVQLTKRSQLTVDGMLIRPSKQVDSNDIEGVLSLRLGIAF